MTFYQRVRKIYSQEKRKFDFSITFDSALNSVNSEPRNPRLKSEFQIHFTL